MSKIRGRLYKKNRWQKKETVETIQMNDMENKKYTCNNLETFFLKKEIDLKKLRHSEDKQAGLTC